MKRWRRMRRRERKTKEKNDIRDYMFPSGIPSLTRRKTRKMKELSSTASGAVPKKKI